MKKEFMIKEECSNHQFFDFFDSIIKNNIIDISIDTKKIEEKINIEIFEKEFNAQCFKNLMYLSLKTLVLDLNLFSEAYEDKEKAYIDYLFCMKSKDGIEKFFIKYDGLKKQIDKEIEYLKNSSTIFLRRLYCDFEILEKKFKVVKKIQDFEFSKGDSHCKKQSVIKVVFENKNIFYKPQAFETINILSDITKELEKDNILVFKIPNTLYCDRYMWQEEIKYSESSEVEAVSIYRQYGVLACFAYIFNISDLHMNNLIVSGDELYLIDIETFHQRNIHKNVDDNSLTSEVYGKIKNTALNTGLFPVQFKKYKNIDVSGICGKGNQIVDNGKYEIINKNRGDMRLVKKQYFIEEGMNIVKINNKVINPRDFIREIIYGFDVCYNYFLLRKNYISSILSKYKECRTRLIYRNTSDYSKFLLVATNPKYMVSESNRHNLFSLFRKSERFIDEKIIENEICDLMNGDIPYFTVDIEGNVYNSSFNKIAKLNKYENIGLTDRLKKLSYSDLNFQINLMKIGLAKPHKKWEVDNEKSEYQFKNSMCDENNDEIFLKTAIKIFDDSIENAMKNKKEITWLGVDITESEQWVISPVNNCLYNGLIGNAIAFLYLYDTTKDCKYYNTLNKIINTIDNVKEIWDSDDYSVFLGKGGFIYLYYLLWKKINLLEYKKLFFSEIDRINAIDLETQNIDYISGVSGLLVVLCNIYEVEEIDSLYKIIVNISEYIISKKKEKENWYVWYSDIDENEILNGLSHGLSGVAYSLIKSWKITKNKKYYEVALSAVDFENTRKKDDNWVDFRNYEKRRKIKFKEPVYWCHGAAGIGMMRSKISRIIDNESMKSDLLMAIHTVVEKGNINSDCLCHGKFGNLELLMLEDENNNFALHKDISLKLIKIIKDSNGKWKSGIPQDERMFTLMLGEIGIAYQLLRFYTCYKVPSILMLDVPKE